MDESDRTIEWGAGEFVAVEIDVPPLHRVVEFRFPEITVAEKLPLGEIKLLKKVEKEFQQTEQTKQGRADEEGNDYNG
nr:hypothetical protein CFP56_27970 [Quercus suber]